MWISRECSGKGVARAKALRNSMEASVAEVRSGRTL